MNTLPLWLDLMIASLLVVGSTLTLIGSYGLAKLGDFVKRLHGPTKATTMGIGCVLIASFAYFVFQGTNITAHEVLVTVFLFLTAPISAHKMISAALRSDPAVKAPPPPET